VPVGSYLSGGLDSSIITALSNVQNTWTVGFKDDNEFSWSKKVSKLYKTIHSSLEVTDSDFLETARSMILQRKEPLSVPNEVLLFLMTKKVKKLNTVVLSGEGADELFFGYDRIFKFFNQNSFSLNDFDRLYSYGSFDDIEILEDVLSPFKIDSNEPIRIVSSFFQKAHLHGLLRRLDNSTMLSSVEARVPFVDHRLIERIFPVSYSYKIRDSVAKHPLKSLAKNKNLLPSEIIYREKVGFPVNLKQVFNIQKNINPMDIWLEFNLKNLGIEYESRQ